MPRDPTLVSVCSLLLVLSGCSTLSGDVSGPDQSVTAIAQTVVAEVGATKTHEALVTSAAATAITGASTTSMPEATPPPTTTPTVPDASPTPGTISTDQTEGEAVPENGTTRAKDAAADETGIDGVPTPGTGPTVTPVPREVVESLPPPGVPEGWHLYVNADADLSVAVKDSWHAPEVAQGHIVFLDDEGAFVRIVYDDRYAFEFETDNPILELQDYARQILAEESGVVTIDKARAEAPYWQMGPSLVVVIPFVPVSVVQDGITKSHGWVSLVPKPAGRYAVITYLLVWNPDTSAAENDMRLLSTSLRFGAAAQAAREDYQPTPTPKPVSICYRGQLKEHLEYPGIGIETRVYDLQGKPVPGVRIEYSAWNTLLWDQTMEQGTVRRDGFSMPIEWELRLPDLNAEPMAVQLEAGKLAIVEINAYLCD